jgi:hypothetical protein
MVAKHMRMSDIGFMFARKVVQRASPELPGMRPAVLSYLQVLPYLLLNKKLQDANVGGGMSWHFPKDAK